MVICMAINITKFVRNQLQDKMFYFSHGFSNELILFEISKKAKICLTLSLPSTSKNQYLSATHVSRNPEYLGFMGSTQSISRTIQPIAVKLSQNVAYI